MELIKITTKHKKEIVDITGNIQKFLSGQKNSVGAVLIFVKHTTCALATADLDPGTDKDYLSVLEQFIPTLDFNHPHDPGHFPDHFNSTLIGPSLTLPFDDNQLILGTWQRAVLVELNGARTRELLMRIL